LQQNTLSHMGWGLWANLTRRIGPGRIPQKAFDAFCGAFVTNSVNLIPIGVDGFGEAEVLLIWREDEYCHGWHFPGKILLPGQTSEGTLDETIETELGPDAKVEILSLLGVFDIMKGTGVGESPRGQEVSQVYIGLVRFVEDIAPDDGEWEWFPLDDLSRDLIDEQRPHLEAARVWVRNNQARLQEEDPIFQ